MNLKRKRNATALLLVLALGLGACASPEGDNSANGQGTSNDGVGRSADDELVIALNAALASIDPLKSNSQRTEGNVQTSVYSTLTQVNPDGELVGDLAESWEQVDPLTWAFEIREGVTFTNGNPLGPEEVVWGINRYFDESLGGKGFSSIPGFESISVADDGRVELKTSSPDFQVPYTLEQYYLLDPVWTAENDPSSQAVGSGPYKIVSYDPQGEIKLERNDDFYGAAPYFKNVTFRVIPEESSRIAALKTSEIDVLTSFDPQSLDQLTSESDLEVGAVEGLRTHFLMLDQRESPLDDIRVRQALNYAIDKETIASAIFKDLVTPGIFINEGTPGYDSTIEPYPFDPEKAKELLAEAGYENGLQLKISNAPGAYAGDDLTIQAIAAQFADVGVDATIENLPYTTYLEYALEQDGKKAYPVTFRSYGGSSAATLASSRYSGYLSGRSLLQNSTEYDDLIEQAQGAATAEEQDEFYRRANNYLHDNASLVYLFNEPLTYAYSTDLEWTPRPEQWLRPQDFTAAQ